MDAGWIFASWQNSWLTATNSNTLTYKLLQEDSCCILLLSVEWVAVRLIIMRISPVYFLLILIIIFDHGFVSAAREKKNRRERKRCPRVCLREISKEVNKLKVGRISGKHTFLINGFVEANRLEAYSFPNCLETSIWFWLIIENNDLWTNVRSMAVSSSSLRLRTTGRNLTVQTRDQCKGLKDVKGTSPWAVAPLLCP